MLPWPQQWNGPNTADRLGFQEPTKGLLAQIGIPNKKLFLPGGQLLHNKLCLVLDFSSLDLRILDDFTFILPYAYGSVRRGPQ